jgi:pyridoxal phosphate enzyme (YggS family)
MSLSEEQEIHANIVDTLAAMKAASGKAGRPPEDTQLLVVSKTWPTETIRLAASFPHTHFGESRVQEVVAKIPAMPANLHWHLIGHLQKNKIRKVLPFCRTLHSVESLDLARQIDRIAAEEGLRPEVYLQVNIADDGAKFGFSRTRIITEMEDALSLANLNISGLMTIPAFSTDPEETRPHFAALRKLRDELEAQFDVRLPGLSMGMSGDYAVAIEEGSTIVRVGTAIFGNRSRPVETT